MNSQSRIGRDKIHGERTIVEDYKQNGDHYVNTGLRLLGR